MPLGGTRVASVVPCGSIGLPGKWLAMRTSRISRPKSSCGCVYQYASFPISTRTHPGAVSYASTRASATPLMTCGTSDSAVSTCAHACRNSSLAGRKYRSWR